MQATVAVFGFLRFPAEKLDDIRTHLKILVDSTYASDGCIAYDVAEDLFDKGLIRFAELWPDQATLDRHLDAPHIEPWRQAARHFGLMERQFVAYSISGSKTI